MQDLIALVSVDCGHKNSYWVRKNKKKNPDRLERTKYCPLCRKHVLHREKK